MILSKLHQSIREFCFINIHFCVSRSSLSFCSKHSHVLVASYRETNICSIKTHARTRGTPGNSLQIYWSSTGALTSANPPPLENQFPPYSTKRRLPRRQSPLFHELHEPAPLSSDNLSLHEFLILVNLLKGSVHPKNCQI